MTPAEKRWNGLDEDAAVSSWCSYKKLKHLHMEIMYAVWEVKERPKAWSKPFYRQTDLIAEEVAKKLDLKCQILNTKYQGWVSQD